MAKSKGLYIEDDEGWTILVTHALSHGDYPFVLEFACSGRQGISALKSGSYDFVVLDWNLPDFTAPELAKMALTEDSSLPVISTSSCYFEEQRLIAKKSGIIKCIEKNRASELLDEIAEMFSL